MHKLSIDDLPKHFKVLLKNQITNIQQFVITV